MSSDIGKGLVVLGLLLTITGIYLLLGGKLGFLGRLPGDIRIERENFTLFIPLGTCFLISSLLSLLYWLFKR